MAVITKKYPYTGDEYFFIISNQKECKEVASYIFNKAGDFLTSKEALSHAARLLIYLTKDKSVKEVTEDILNGREDERIDSILRVEKYSYLSVKKQEDEKKAIPIKVSKKPILTAKVKKLIAFGLAVAAVGTIYGNVKATKKENEDNHQISTYIGKLGSEVDSEDYTYNRNIIDQNKRKALDNTYLLDYQSIAMDILEVANGNPDLIELCFYDAYQNLDYDKLTAIDNIFTTLKLNVRDDLALEGIKDDSVYLEYVLDNAVKRNLVDESSSLYSHLQNAINNYKNVRLTSSGMPYNNLSDSDKASIDKLMGLAEKMKKDLGETYKVLLEARVNERESSRGL